VSTTTTHTTPLIQASCSSAFGTLFHQFKHTIHSRLSSSIVPFSFWVGQNTCHCCATQCHLLLLPTTYTCHLPMLRCPATAHYTPYTTRCFPHCDPPGTTACHTPPSGSSSLNAAFAASAPLRARHGQRASRTAARWHTYLLSYLPRNAPPLRAPPTAGIPLPTCLPLPTLLPHRKSMLGNKADTYSPGHAPLTFTCHAHAHHCHSCSTTPLHTTTFLHIRHYGLPAGQTCLSAMLLYLPASTVSTPARGRHWDIIPPP